METKKEAVLDEPTKDATLSMADVPTASTVVPAYRSPALRGSATGGASPVKTGARVRPNAFVAIRIPSLQIKEGLEKVQESVVKFDRRLKGALTSLNKLHLTLLVLTLKDNDDIKR